MTILIPYLKKQTNKLTITFPCLHFTFKESVWQLVQEVHHLHRGRGVVRASRYPIPPAAWYQEAASSAAETVWPLQHRHWDGQWLLRYPVGRHPHWEHQQWATGLSDKVSFSLYLLQLDLGLKYPKPSQIIHFWLSYSFKKIGAARCRVQWRSGRLS